MSPRFILPRSVRILLVWVGFAGTLGAAARPNVLFIAVDDLRPELLCYGKTHIISPNIDKLAASGVLFSRAYCQQAVCNPSRASVLTGLRPDSTGVYGNGTHFRARVPDAVTLPQYFTQHGYHTQAFGKIFHGSFENAYVGRKFDDDRSWSAPIWQPGPRFYYTPHGVEVARKVFARESGKRGAALEEWTEAFVKGLATEAPEVPDDVLYDGQITDRAIEVLRTLPRGGKPANPAADKPFFLAVGYMKPHVPFVAPKKYWDLYDPAKIVLPANIHSPRDAPPMATWNWPDLRGYDDMPKEGPVTPGQARHLLHGYYACVSFVDAQIGRLLGELEQLGLRENTVVVFWGDHGFHLGEYGMWSKNTNFEYATRAPLIVSAPGVAGARTDALVELVDIYPSLCELAGLPVPTSLEGASFAPLMKSPQRPWKTAAFSQFPRSRPALMGYSLRTDQHRLTVWHPPTDPSNLSAVELYDHRADPEENINIASAPENSPLVAKLTAQLRAGWRAALPPQW